MALNPMEVAYQTGATLYFIIHNKNGTVWNNSGSAFEVYNSAHWSQYAIALTEQAGSGYYSAAMPTAIGINLVTECTYAQQGGSPALSDAASGPIGIGQSQGVDVAAVEHQEQSASNMGVNLASLVQGTVTSASTPSSGRVSTNLTSTLNNNYNNRLIIFITGAMAGEVSTITSYLSTNGLLGFNVLTGAPSVGDTFLII